MAAKIKGIYKGFKSISQIFAVVKNTELEIGHPTDVKHVAHIGSEGTNGHSPSWMGEFKGGSDSFSPRQSFVSARQSNSSSVPLSFGSSQDFDQTIGQQTDLPNIPKKQRHKKKSSSSSRKSSSNCSSKSSSSSRSATSLLI